jgi:hypothetical protein
MMADLRQLTIIDLLDLAELRNDSQSVHSLLEEIRRRVIDMGATLETKSAENWQLKEDYAKARNEIQQARLQLAHRGEWDEP